MLLFIPPYFRCPDDGGFLFTCIAAMLLRTSGTGTARDSLGGSLS